MSVSGLNNFQVEKNDDERKEAVMSNTDEAMETYPTVSNDDVKNQDEMTNASNIFEQEKVLGTETTNVGENLNEVFCEHKKEDAVDVKIYSAKSHTTPHSDKGKEQKVKEDTHFSGEAKISSSIGSDIQRSGKVLRKAEVPAVDQKNHEHIETNRSDSQRLEEKQDDSIANILNDTKTDGIRKNEIKLGSKRTDERGRSHSSHSSRRKSSHSSRDFEMDVSDSQGHHTRKSRYLSEHRSSSHRIKDDIVSNSTDVAHFSGWHEKESYDNQKHGTPDRYAYEEENYKSRAVKKMIYKERSYKRKSSNQRLSRRESEHSLYWSDDDSNSSWNEQRADEDYVKKRLKIQENESDTEGIENKSLLSNLIRKSGITINEDVRRKFAKACVSFLKTANQDPSCHQENYANDDWHTDEDAEPHYNQKRIFYNRGRNDSHKEDAERQHDHDMPCSPKLGYISDEWCTDQNSGDSSRSRPFDSRRHHRERDASFSPSYSRRHRHKSKTDAERQYGHDWSCSPKLGYSSDQWHTDQNSRNSSRKRAYGSGRHNREHDATYSASHSQRYRISGAEKQHGQNWTCCPEMDYNPDEWSNDQDLRGGSRRRQYNSWKHHKEYDASHSASCYQRHGHASSITDDDENMETSLYRHTSEKIQKQCERERDSATRQALLSLFDAHDRECSQYLKQPDAHPDYNKEYRIFFQNKTKSILELGGDPTSFNFYQEWKKYWPSRMNAIFIENWKTKMQLCTSFLTQKNNSSSSESSTDLDSSSSSDELTNSSTRLHSHSKRKRKSRYSKSKDISAKGKSKQEKKRWKPLNVVEMGTEDMTLELDIKRNRERSESPSLDKCKRSKQEVDADEIALELMIKRYREMSESQPVDKCQIERQASSSPRMQNQNMQGYMAIQVVDILKVLNHIKVRFDELEEPLNSLYLKAVELKENNLDQNDILNEEGCCSLILKLGEKLEKMLEDKNLSVIEKVIAREAHERFSHLLLRVKEKSVQMGLDIGSIARNTMGKSEGETLMFIKNVLLYQGHPCVSDEKVINIYLEVEEQLKSIEYLSNAQAQMANKDTEVSLCQDESNSNNVEPSELHQSECQSHIQPAVSSAHRDSRSSFNSPPNVASVMLDSTENNATRTLKPASPLQSSSNSREKTPLVPSPDFKNKERTPPVELKIASPVAEGHPPVSGSSSPSTPPLVASPELSTRAEPSAATVLASQVVVIPSNNETITAGSECELMEDSKFYQNTIKDCFTSPSSSPKRDLPSFSLQDCAKFDFENPENFLIPFPSSLGIGPFESSLNAEKPCDSNSGETVSSAVSKPNADMECQADLKSSKHSEESGDNVERHEKPSTGVSKKPIRITIPQLSKQKVFDDQELI